ncbi:MAG: M20 family metallopeptidase [Thermomicrobiales bacterium]
MTASTHPHLAAEIDEILPGVIADRRHLHQHPELGFHEVETARFVTERLRALGVEDIRTGINVTGITGLIRGTKASDGPTRTILLRADMDALPIVEETGAEYASLVEGVMHACGHDAHTAILLGVARVLGEQRATFSGTVKLLFQPAEEIGDGGAKGMIEQGVLEDPHVDAVFGLHMNPAIPADTVMVGAGPLFAAVDSFAITVHGKGGHGAYPNTAIDPITAGMHIVFGLQQLISRELDPMVPAVVNVCTFHAGTATNIVPPTATLSGTVRSFDPELRDRLEARIRAIAEGTAAALGSRAEIDYHRGYPAGVTDEAFSAFARDVLVAQLGADRVQVFPQEMGAEDFAYFLQHRPGTFIYCGSGNVERGITYDCHHPRFDIDEDALATGIEATVTVALRFLAGDAAR